MSNEEMYKLFGIENNNYTNAEAYGKSIRKCDAEKSYSVHYSNSTKTNLNSPECVKQRVSNQAYQS